MCGPGMDRSCFWETGAARLSVTRPNDELAERTERKIFNLKHDDENDTFRVKRTIGSSYNTDGDDALKTKSALGATGDYKPPKWGMTSITDDGMFDGLKKFQKREGLQVDGVMRPGGPTEKKLRERTSAVKIASATNRPIRLHPRPAPNPRIGWIARHLRQSRVFLTC